MDFGKIVKALKKMGVKNADEASPETIQKALKLAKNESDAVPNNLLGKGKNLEALEAAKFDAPSMEAPAYPKNIQQDDLAAIPESRTKEFTMVPEGSQVPAVSKGTLPKAPEVVEATPMLPAVRGNTMPGIVDAELADPKKSNMLRNLLAGGTAAGAAGLMLGGDGSQQSEAQIPFAPEQPKVEAPVVAPKAAPVAKEEGGLDPLNTDMSSLFKPLPEEERAPASELDYLDMLQRAQAGQADMDFTDNMLRAGTTIGSALAGTKADYSQVDALQKQNTKGTERVKGLMTADMEQTKLKSTKADLADEEKLRDPNSDMSKTLRDMLSKLGYPVNEKVSGKQLKDMGINVYNLLAQKEAREQRKLDREATKDNSNLERTKASIEKRFQNLTANKDFKSYQNTKDAIAAFDYALASKDKEAVGTAFMKFAKSAQGDDSVVRSEDMRTLAGGTPFGNPKKMMDHYIALAQGKNFTTAELQNMKKIMQASLKAKGADVYRLASPMLKKIESNGLPLDEFVDPGMAEEFSQYSTDKKDVAPETKVIGGVTYKKVQGGWEPQ